MIHIVALDFNPGIRIATKDPEFRRNETSKPNNRGKHIIHTFFLRARMNSLRISLTNSGTNPNKRAINQASASGICR